MKKVKILPVFLVSILLTGCVSDARYNELLSRVETLEAEIHELRGQIPDAEEKEYLVSDESSNEEGTNMGSDELSTSAGVGGLLNSESVQEQESAVNQQTSEKIVETPKKDPYTYYIDSLSVDEIVNEVDYYINAYPVAGETYAQQDSKIKAIPCKSEYSYDDSKLYYVFIDEKLYYENPTRDVIKSIRFSGTQEEMDGTIGFGPYRYEDKMVSIELVVLGYDRAVALYDGLYNHLESHYKQVRDNRNSTRWSATGSWNYSEHSFTSIDFLTMSKQQSGDLFSFKISYIIE